ncbi:MAG: saccharopine dehydrogenase NADP-binding domain-containing protein [Bacteroidota bacterium]
MSTSKFDVIVWGASGFTGRLVAEYYLHQYGLDGDLKWAMAGRNNAKLEQVRKELGNEDIPILIADSMDMDSLNNLVQQTKVICTTVGPYAKYGNQLVEACVANTVDYCDLTGEVQWIRRMIDQHHEAALANGTRIVHCCGFDSIPSEMGVYFLQQQAKAQHGEYCSYIKYRLKAAKGKASGGTIASLANVMAEAEQDNSIYEMLANPYGLNPKDQQRGKDGADQTGIVFDADANAWTGPFIMAGINTRVVRRSHALAGFPYGEDFRYDEAMISGTGFSGKMKARMIAGTMSLAQQMKPGSMVQKLADRFLPKPGEGPNKKERETGFWNVAFYGHLPNGERLQAKVTGDRDPGYGSTSKMLGESAVCLAKDKTKTPKVSGVITPSYAMGDALLERLQANAGLTFEMK